jgi:hypothetical protein
MLPSLAGRGRHGGVEHHPRDGFWVGLLQPEDGGDVRGAVPIGPVAARRTDAQAYILGEAVHLEDTMFLSADGVDL